MRTQCLCVASFVAATLMAADSKPAPPGSPPEFTATTGAQFRALGIAEAGDDKSNILALDSGSHHNYYLFSWQQVNYEDGKTQCLLILHNWGGHEYFKVQIKYIDSCWNGFIRADVDEERNFSELFDGIKIVVIKMKGNNPFEFGDYYAIWGQIIALPVLGEDESWQLLDWDGDGRTDVIIKGWNFSCSRLEPNYTETYTRYLYQEWSSHEWRMMNGLQQVNIGPVQDRIDFLNAQAKYLANDKKATLELLHAMESRNPEDPFIRRNIKYAELTLSDCGKIREQPMKRAKLCQAAGCMIDDAVDGNTLAFVEGFSAMPPEEIFRPGLAAFLLTSPERDGGGSYYECAKEHLYPRDLESNICLNKNADIWFVKGWLDYQLGRAPEEVLPSFRRAMQLAPQERFYRDMLRYFATSHPAAPPARHH